MTDTNQWEPTVGTLSAEALDEIGTLILGNYAGMAEPGYRMAIRDIQLLRAHSDALTKQLESARGIAVRLENDAAEARHRIGLVRELHFRNALADLPPDDPNYSNAENICCGCLEDWPCPTIRALGEAADGEA